MILFSPMTVFEDKNAHIHAISGGTVKLVRAHCDSTYELKKLNVDRLDLRFKSESFNANM